MATTSSRLLELPRELRDLIWLEAMQQRWPAPEHVMAQIHDQEPGCVCHPLEPAKLSRPLNLLSTNRQIRREAQEVIQTLQQTNAFRVELDLTVFGFRFAPVLRYVNLGMPRQAHFDLHVHLIVQSTEALRTSAPLLLHMLNAMLFYGPAFHTLPSGGPRRGPYFIETLHLHMSFDDYYHSDTWSSAVRAVGLWLRLMRKFETCHRYLGAIRFTTAEFVRGDRPTSIDNLMGVPRPPFPKAWDKYKITEKHGATIGYLFGESWWANVAGQSSVGPCCCVAYLAGAHWQIGFVEMGTRYAYNSHRACKAQ